MHRIVPLLLVCGCAATPAHPIPIALVVDGDRAALGNLPPTIDGLAIHEVVLPAPPPAPASDAQVIVTRARSAYAKGDLDACRSELTTVDVAQLLAAGDRATASRALAFDAACAWAAMAKSDAKTDAERLAAYGLDLPESAVAPDVEAMIGAALADAGKAPKSKLALTGEIGARLVVDGRPGGCALPCSIELSPGDHVIAVDADGFSPAVQHVRTPDSDHLAIAQQPAPGPLAAQQWRARLGRGQPAADAIGASLIARFTGEPRVAFVHGDASLAGALVVAGKLAASDQAARGDTVSLVRELAYDGNVLHRPPVWQKPWFWIAVSGAVVVIAGVVTAVTYTPKPVTSVGL